MRRLATTIAALVLSAGTGLADPAQGLWKTEPGDSGGYLHVAITPCGEALCGTIRQAFDSSGAKSAGYEHLGKRMIWNMQSKGSGNYAGGQIWAPDRDKTYKSKMSLKGNTLNVSGCVTIICRSQSWTRVR